MSYIYTPIQIHNVDNSNNVNIRGRKLSDCFAESLEGTESTTSGSWGLGNLNPGP